MATSGSSSTPGKSPAPQKAAGAKTTKTTRSSSATKGASTSKARRTAAPKLPPTLRSFNPRTGETLGEVPTIDPAEVAEVVARARKVAPEWAAIPPAGRVRILKEVRHRLYELMDEIVETVAAECGKPRTEALAHDVLPALMMMSYLERATEKALKPKKVGRIAGGLLGLSSRVEWRPFGVVGCITPWNYPITNSFLAFISPLFAGNVVVIKPSEVTPACGELLRKILEPLPSGVATVIQGGGDVGAALVDAGCDKISFVGSPRTGRLICAAAAKHLTPVVMELGGKDAALVASDADIDVASSGVLWGSFFNAGQTCCSIERVYVVDSIADEFTSALLGKLQKVRHGGDDGDVGSLTFARQLDIVKEQVDDAVKHGARLLAGGPDVGVVNENGSLWYAPTIIENVNDEMKVLHEETFGPIVTITRVQDEDEGVRRANEEAANLTASVWTKSKKRADELARQMKAGAVASNTHGQLPAVPWAGWGGVGESGFGRLNGELGLQEFSVPVHVAINQTPSMKNPWWFPYDDATRNFTQGAIKLLGSPRIADKVSGLSDIARNIRTAIKGKL
jgi:acyl-CoA reductase-like NAD-dependent aldehyde dehydrogenase